MKRSARITLHPEALQNNIQIAKQYAPHAKINAVIKANAYGHGAVETAGILYEFSDGFAVSCLPEAIELRQAGIDLPITVLQGHQNMDDLRAAAHYKLRLVVHDDQQLFLLENYSHAGHEFELSIKIDTGMHRLGFKPETATTIYQRLSSQHHVNNNELIMMTHFSSADDVDADNKKTTKQIQCFEEACSNISSQKSMANSAAILAWKNSHADWIRPGIMLYGSSPITTTHRDEYKLKAAMTFNAPIISIHNLKQGDSIGYAASWTCPNDMRVAVIACGYADGYPRHAPSGTPVWVNNYEAKLVGRVSMDMIVIDINNSETSDISVGDLAELWGQNLSVDIVAQHAETIGYELLCNAGNLCEKMGV